ncbi:MAG: EAL domain-containing protein [Pseudomonadota bacterium]
MMDLADLFDQSLDLVARLDNGGSASWLNARWRTLGWRQDELLGTRFLDQLLDFPSDRERLLERLASDRETFTFSTRLQHPGGQVRWAEWQLSPCGPGQWLTQLRDIHSHRHTQESLVEQRRLLELATSLTLVGYWELEMPDWKLTWSSGMYPLFGVDARFTPRLNAVLDRLEPGDGDKVREALEKSVKERRPVSYTYRVRWPTGHLRHLKSRVICQFDGYGQPSRLFGVVQDITQHEEAMLAAEKAAQKLSYQANHDALTGLANRRVLERSLNELNLDVRSGRKFSLALLDLDRFKLINDSCGHVAGDELLRELATILTDAVRTEDLVVRLGGDEFAVLLVDLDRETAAAIAEQIRSAVESFVFVHRGESHRLTVSIGLTSHRAGAEPTEVMRDVDGACYAAKARGRNQVYQAELERNGAARADSDVYWVNRINQALEQDRFVLFSQPVQPLGKHEGGSRHEILLRLRDGEELITPGAYMPVAERFDLSPRIDRWVVASLIRMLHACPSLLAAGQSYWVNLSGCSMGDARFVDFLEEQVRDSGLAPATINFEITETAVIRNLAVASELMNRLKDLGCQFALDDFGTGVSSFGYLRRLPVDYIKIDGMFVRNVVNDQVDEIFVKSIIDIAEVMGIKSVVEFVESREVLAAVTRLGADFAQGYALGRPAELAGDGGAAIVPAVGAGGR